MRIAQHASRCHSMQSWGQLHQRRHTLQNTKKESQKTTTTTTGAPPKTTKKPVVSLKTTSPTTTSTDGGEGKPQAFPQKGKSLL